MQVKKIGRIRWLKRFDWKLVAVAAWVAGPFVTVMVSDILYPKKYHLTILVICLFVVAIDFVRMLRVRSQRGRNGDTKEKGESK